MGDCRNFDPLFAPYVDDEQPEAERRAVDAHLQACPPCREAVAGERAARDILRARRHELRGQAPAGLHARCASLAPSSNEGTARVVSNEGAAGVVSNEGAVRVAAASPRLSRRALASLSLAATVLLAVGGVFVLGLNSTVEALAAQLALDHVKCFQLPPERTTAEADELGQRFSERQGWSLRVPASAAGEGMELLGVRRCGSTHGAHAHLMYRWRGEPLSVFVIPTDTGAGAVDRRIRRAGHDAIVWTQGGRTYAVVAHGASQGLQQVAAYVRRTAH